jgi:hypothetical protein
MEELPPRVIHIDGEEVQEGILVPNDLAEGTEGLSGGGPDGVLVVVEVGEEGVFE